jgi:hypothetical protein
VADPVTTVDIGTMCADACELGPKPISMTKFLRRFLTTVFSSADNLEDQSVAVQRMVWTNNPATTGIAIEMAGGWTPELTEKRPAVIIRRGDWNRVRGSIDDRCLPDSPDGHTYHGNFWQASHTLMCMTGDSVESDLLMAEVFRQLNQFGPAIRKGLQIMRFEVVKGAEQVILEQEARENFVAAVSIAYAYQEFWQLKNLTAQTLAETGVGLAQQS